MSKNVLEKEILSRERNAGLIPWKYAGGKFPTKFSDWKSYTPNPKLKKTKRDRETEKIKYKEEILKTTGKGKTGNL